MLEGQEVNKTWPNLAGDMHTWSVMVTKSLMEEVVFRNAHSMSQYRGFRTLCEIKKIFETLLMASKGKVNMLSMIPSFGILMLVLALTQYQLS